jgi:aspartate racemase
MKRIGILGGMGPLATADLFLKIIELTDAKKDQDNIPIIIDNFPQIPDRTAFILEGKEDPFPFMKEAALRLKNAGCEVICISCNTAHYFASRLEKECSVKILHIAKISVAAIKQKFPSAKKIAVIATTGTISAKIYENELTAVGLECVEISQNLLDDIMKCIYSGAKANCLSEYVGLFNKTLEKIKADVYIAACTEIPLFLPFTDKKDCFIDATLELANAAVKFGLDK